MAPLEHDAKLDFSGSQVRNAADQPIGRIDFSGNAPEPKPTLPLPAATPPPTWNVLSLAFYQPYFDVRTADVKERFLVPFSQRTDFLTLAGGGDMYGPVWVVITLIFALAVVSNAALYIEHCLSPQSHLSFFHDVQKLNSACTVVFTAFGVFPPAVYAMLRRGGSQVTLVPVVSLVGYSWAPFLVAAPLLILPLYLAKLLALLAAAGISGHCVHRNLKTELDLLPAVDQSLLLGGSAVAYLAITYCTLTMVTSLSPSQNVVLAAAAENS